jgi:hypothetical protein
MDTNANDEKIYWHGSYFKKSESTAKHLNIEKSELNEYTVIYYFFRNRWNSL